MRRTIFTDEHEQFRQMVRTFLEKECVPHTAEWLEAGVVSREAWRRAGELGLLGWMVPEEYGGLGIRDFRYSVVVAEEIAATGTQGIALALHNDVVAPYLTDLTNPEQKKRWLPGFVTGERLVAIAMSEPGAGSDLKQVKATARRDGDHYILNGTKTFISNGILADLVIVVARTDPEAGHRGMSLLVVEEGFEGFERGRKLDKIGNRAQDTAELFFRDVRVPAANVLGAEGRGFYHLMRNLPAGAARHRRVRDRPRGPRLRGDRPVRPGPARLRPAHRRFPGQPVRAGGDEDQAGCRARLPRPVRAGGARRRAHRG